jgi:hypothetical protein
MSATITNLHFEKLNNSSCRITCRQAGNNRAINPDLTQQERKTTALLLLCDILEDNETGSELLATIRCEINKYAELFLAQNESITDHNKAKAIKILAALNLDKYSIDKST